MLTVLRLLNLRSGKSGEGKDRSAGNFCLNESNLCCPFAASRFGISATDKHAPRYRGGNKGFLPH